MKSILLSCLMLLGCFTIKASTISLKTSNFTGNKAVIQYLNYNTFNIDTLSQFTLIDGKAETLGIQIPWNGFYSLVIGKKEIFIFLESDKDYDIEIDVAAYPLNFKVNSSIDFYLLLHQLNNNWMYAEKSDNAEIMFGHIKNFKTNNQILIANGNVTEKEKSILEFFLAGILNSMKSNAMLLVPNDQKAAFVKANEVYQYNLDSELMYEVIPQKFLKMMLYNSYHQNLKTTIYDERAYLNYIELMIDNKQLKNYLMADYISSAIRSAEGKKIDSLLGILREKVTSEIVLNNVGMKYKKNYKSHYLLPDIDLNNIKGEKVSTSSFLGKITLIDFWALWCAPCMADKPALGELEKFFSKNGNFQVVRVSIDTEKDAWLNHVKKEKYLNLWSEGGFKADLSVAVDLSSIPRYMIIDENGKVVHEDAPRPTDTRLYEFVRAELNRLGN